jgi:hypothetical protein
MAFAVFEVSRCSLPENGSGKRPGIKRKKQARTAELLFNYFNKIPACITQSCYYLVYVKAVVSSAGMCALPGVYTSL